MLEEISLKDNLHVIKNGNEVFIINKDNGKALEIDMLSFQDKKILKEELEFNDFYSDFQSRLAFNVDLFKTVYISLHISNQCNMKCKYCFMQERSNDYLSLDEIKMFIDLIINYYPNAGKFIVDPTGSGEPLLELDLLCQVGEYCKEKSDELKKEVLPMIVTNGLLLTNKVVERLRNAGILFGVSLDGDKSTNDKYRFDYKHNGTYKRVIRNIKKIKDRSLIGVALTITENNLNHLIKYFPTISMKPVRAIDSNIGINEMNIDYLLDAYTDLNNYLIEQTSKGNMKYLSAILNGDDYFGKFLLRTIVQQKVTTRCDAGVGRFSLAPDGKIYACPGGIGIKDLVVGSLDKGINVEKREILWGNLTNSKSCEDCFAKFVCGGECFVNAYYSLGKITDKDEIMCILKRHLYKLALMFNSKLKQMKHYGIVFHGCIRKLRRFDEDMEVTKFLNQNPSVSFTEIKKNRNSYLRRKL
jgi:uncharacterized protein